MTDEIKTALHYLEELAEVTNYKSWHGEVEITNPDLFEFTNEVYSTLHYLTAPDCRKNHADFRPAWQALEALSSEDVTGGDKAPKPSKPLNRKEPE